MSRKQWTAVDDYMAGRLVAPDEALSAVLAANAGAGLPAIDVSPLQGKLLHLLARIAGARKVLRSARWGATRRSGWRARCPRTGSW